MAIAAIISAMGRAGGAAGGAATAATHGQYGNAIKMVGQALGQTRSVAGQATAAMHKFNHATGGMVSALAAGSNAIKALAGPLTHFVGLRSPAAVTQFTLAMRDMEATIGQILLPVFNALTSSARSMGDTYATLADAIKPAMTGIATAITTVFKEIGSVARENAGAIRLVANVLGGMAVATGNIISLVMKLTSAFHPWLKVLRDAAELLGLGGPPDEKTARGMAIRNISIGTSGGDLARRAQEGAFREALNRGQPKEEPQITRLDSIYKALTDILGVMPTKEFLQGLANTAKSGGSTAAKTLPGGGTFQGGHDLGRWAKSLLTR
jgi:hypothetical protein